MAKFALEIRTDKSTGELNGFLSGFLGQRGFARKGKPELNEWRKGFYWVRFLRFTFAPGLMSVKAWINFPYPGMGSFVKYFMGKAELKKLLEDMQESFGKGSTVSFITPESGTTPQSRYAGFWRRFGAALIDMIIIFVVSTILSMAVFPIFRKAFHQANQVLPFLTYILMGVIGWLFFTLFESSKTQATPGKMALHIIVTDADAKRISFARASGRYWAKMLSIITVNVGFVIAAFTPKKQALHDLISGCLVVMK